MKIIRYKSKEHVTINNAIMFEKGLSLKAKGLFSLVMSLPDNWDFSVVGVCAITKENECAIRAAIDELIKAGYCSRQRVREDGKYVACRYEFYERKNRSPHLENPHVENPRVENRDDKYNSSMNTPINNNENISTINSPDNNKESKSLSNDKQKGWKTDSEFMKFWNLYDYKKGADTAYRAWKKLSKQEKQDAVKAIPLYFEDCREHSRNKRYPATYLNAHTWEDDFTCTGLVEEKEEKEESSTSDWDAQIRWLEKNTPNIAGRMTKEMLRRFKELCMCDSHLLAETLREFDKIYDGGNIMKEFEELCKKR